MKRIIFLVIIGTALVFTSCTKEFDEIKPVESNSIENISVPSNFDWKTFKDVTLNLTGKANSLVEVISEKGVVYQRAYLTKDELYSMKLSVPTYETSVRLLFMGQNIEIDLNDDVINYEFI